MVTIYHLPQNAKSSRERNKSAKKEKECWICASISGDSFLYIYLPPFDIIAVCRAGFSIAHHDFDVMRCCEDPEHTLEYKNEMIRKSDQMKEIHQCDTLFRIYSMQKIAGSIMTGEQIRKTNSTKTATATATMNIYNSYLTINTVEHSKTTRNKSNK